MFFFVLFFFLYDFRATLGTVCPTERLGSLYIDEENHTAQSKSADFTFARSTTSVALLFHLRKATTEEGQKAARGTRCFRQIRCNDCCQCSTTALKNNNSNTSSCCVSTMSKCVCASETRDHTVCVVVWMCKGGFCLLFCFCPIL